MADDNQTVQNAEDDAGSRRRADNQARGGGAPPTSILRPDLPKHIPATLDLKFLSSQIEPASPQPSVDRLSVTFAEDSRSQSVSRSFTYSTEAKIMDKVHFPEATQEADDSNEEDYSGSVMAIMQRRASMRRSKKRRGSRTSSPFSPDILPEVENGRRRSSCFTISSGDTAITMEDSFSAGVTQEQIFENIKLHKEVLGNVKMQPWNMRRKLRLVQQAKAYVKKHEGALQERLAQSHSTKDIIARWHIYLLKKLQRLKREMANLSNWLIPWELRIKEIESHFGSVVASYFIFLRWLFWVNIAISSIWLAFATIPELLTADLNEPSERKSILPEDKYNATNFLTLWDFEGVFKYSPMFYGWYTNATRTSGGGRVGGGYRLPLAYFFTGLAVYIFSFVATLRKMAENSRMSKLSEKDDECIFSWKLFTGWDYMIGNTETATNRVASIIMGFKEALLEEAEKKRAAQSWKVIGSRILVNVGVLSLLALSAFAVITVVARSKEKGASSTTWRRNEITVVMSLITLFFPMLFELLGYFEYYHPRKQLRLQLARIMVLNLLNLYSLIFALFDKIGDTTNQSGHDNDSQLLASQCESIPTNTFFSSESDTEIKLQVDNLMLDMLSNITTLNGPDEIYDYFVNATSNIMENFNISTTTEYSTVNYALDFTQIQDALQELFTNLFEMFENGTAISSNDSWIFSNVSTLLQSTMAKRLDLVASTAIYTTIPTTIETSESTESTESTDMTETLRSTSSSNPNDYKTRSKLRNLCWETMFGQELVKLTIMDLIMTLLSILLIDFFRGLFVRYMNNCWCWDLEKRFPQYGDFKVAENILHLVNNQGMVWMGMFFSPGLVVINVVKLCIMMYLRSWAVLTCNIPHEIIFRASRSNNFYYALLLMMLFLCVLPVSYAIVWLTPSKHCGPFSRYGKIYHIFTETLRAELPPSTHNILNYIASPGIVIPLLMLLVLIIYYLISLSGALREANNDLKIQLRRERTEERRKMFQIVDRRRRGGSDGSEANNPFGKWKKLLREMPSNKSFENDASTPVDTSAERKNALSKFVTKALKNRAVKEEQEIAIKKPEVDVEDHLDDATDTETHESLPDDAAIRHKTQKTKSRTAQVASREDSTASIIPVITISKTESSECILDAKDGETIDAQPARRLPNQRHVLKKQPAVDENKQEGMDKNVAKDGVGGGDGSAVNDVGAARDENAGRENAEMLHKVLHKSFSTSTGTRTESSTDYKDNTFSN